MEKRAHISGAKIRSLVSFWHIIRFSRSSPPPENLTERRTDTSSLLHRRLSISRRHRRYLFTIAILIYHLFSSRRVYRLLIVSSSPSPAASTQFDHPLNYTLPPLKREFSPSLHSPFPLLPLLLPLLYLLISSSCPAIPTVIQAIGVASENTLIITPPLAHRPTLLIVPAITTPHATIPVVAVVAEAVKADKDKAAEVVIARVDAVVRTPQGSSSSNSSRRSNNLRSTEPLVDERWKNPCQPMTS